MKKYLLAILFCLPLLGWGQKEYSLMGTDFWVSIPNGIGIDSIYISVCSRDTCTVTFESRDEVVTKHTIAYPYNYYDFIDTRDSLSDSISDPIAFYRCSASVAHSNRTNTVTHHSIHVTTSDSAIVHAYAYGTHAGATAIIPTPALQSEYVIQTWPDIHGASFTILAPEDNTEVKIYLTNPSTDHLPVYTPITIHLNAGETYQLISSAGESNSFSGTLVFALKHKKIAVFQSSRNLVIEPTTSPDYTYEQAVPVTYWGQSFIPFWSVGMYSFYQITSLADSCEIYFDSDYVTTINALESFYYPWPYAQRKKLITTSKPSSIYIYACVASNNFDYGYASYYLCPAESGCREGYVTPDYKFDGTTPFPTTHVYPHELRISSLNFSDSIWLDHKYGIPRPIGSVLFSLNSMGESITNGEMKIFSNNGRFFGLKQGGYTPTNHYFYSMYNMIEQNRMFYADSIPSNLLVNAPFCLNHEIIFYVDRDTSGYQFLWDFGDGHSASGPVVRHTYAAAGHYPVSVVYGVSAVPLANQSCDTLRGLVNISPIDTVTTIDSTCRFPYQWDDTLIQSPGTYQRHIAHDNECFHIGRLILTQDTTTVRAFLSDTLCHGDTLAWHSQMLFATGLYADTLAQSNGCDSIVLLDLSVWSKPDVGIRQTTPEGETPIRLQGTIENALDYYHFWWESRPEDVTLHNQEQQLEITVSPDVQTRYTLIAEYDSLPGCLSRATHSVSPQSIGMLWIPNTFTPNLQSNTAFDIIGTEISEFHIAIYNRQGLIVFQSDDIHQSWDGTYNGTPCPTGAYAYTIRYSHSNTPSIILRKSGTVSLLR